MSRLNYVCYSMKGDVFTLYILNCSKQSHYESLIICTHNTFLEKPESYADYHTRLWYLSHYAQKWRRETSLSPLVKYLTDRSQAVLLLWIIYVISVLLLLCFCAHLFIDALWSPAGKGPLGSRLWRLIVKLSLSHWYPVSGVVLDCIDSWSLPSFLL